MEENDKELIAVLTKLPFSQEIREAKLLEGFMLSTIKASEGKSNTQDHLDHYNDLIELHLLSKMAKCRVFAVSLTNGA